MLAVKERSGLGHGRPFGIGWERDTPGGCRSFENGEAMELGGMKKASPVPDIFCENSWATTEPRTISDLKNNAPTKQTTGPDRA